MMTERKKAKRKKLSGISYQVYSLYFFLSLLCLSLDKCEKSILGNNHVFYDISFCAVFFFFMSCQEDGSERQGTDVVINESGDETRAW